MSPKPSLHRAGVWLPRAGPFLLFGLLLLLVYADPVFFRRNFAGRDLLAYNLPMERAVHDAWSRLALPVWMSEISGGRPLLPNPNAGALYPVRGLLAIFPFPLAMRIYPLLHWAAAGWGVMAVLRALGRSRAAAWIGAVTYAFSGVAVSEVFYPHIQPGLALLPLILWALARPFQRPGGRLLLLSILFGLDLLAADVFTVFLAILCGALWVLLEQDRSRRSASLVLLAAGVSLGALLAAPQIVATARWIPETGRAVTGLKLGEAFFNSIHPLRLLELVVPYPFGGNWAQEEAPIWGWPLFRFQMMGLFTTLYSGALAVMALVAGWRSRDAGARFARVAFLAGLALTVPPSLIAGRLSDVPSPFPLRNPEKFSVLLVLSLAIFAGLAVDRYRSRRPKDSWAVAVAGVLAALALAAAVFPEDAGRVAVRLVGSDPRFAVTAGEQLPGALAEAGLLWAVTLLAVECVARRRAVPLVAGLAMLTAVPILANRRIALTFRQDEALAPTAFARMIGKRDPQGAYRTLSESAIQPPSRMASWQLGSDEAYLEASRDEWNEFTHALWGRGTVFSQDFDAGDLSRVTSLRRVAAVAARHAGADEFFGALSLRWGVRYRDQRPLAGFRPFGGDALQAWDEHPEALPDIRLATRWREAAGSVEALHELPTLQTGELILETGRSGSFTAAPGRVETLVKTPERLVLRTESSDPAWLFVLRGFWRHRSVAVDGEPVESVPAMLAFTAVPVPRGSHRIEWRERVPGGGVSRWGPLAFLLGAVALVLRGRSTTRAPSASPRSHDRAEARRGTLWSPEPPGRDGAAAP